MTFWTLVLAVVAGLVLYDLLAGGAVSAILAVIGRFPVAVARSVIRSRVAWAVFVLGTLAATVATRWRLAH